MVEFNRSSVTGAEVPAKVVDNNNGTFSVTYTPKEPGVHTVSNAIKRHATIQSPFLGGCVPEIEADASVLRPHQRQSLQSSSGRSADTSHRMLLTDHLASFLCSWH